MDQQAQLDVTTRYCSETPLLLKFIVQFLTSILLQICFLSWVVFYIIIITMNICFEFWFFPIQKTQVLLNCLNFFQIYERFSKTNTVHHMIMCFLCTKNWGEHSNDQFHQKLICNHSCSVGSDHNAYKEEEDIITRALDHSGHKWFQKFQCPT